MSIDFFLPEIVQIVIENIQKQCLNGKTCKRAVLMEALKAPLSLQCKEDEDVVHALIKRDLKDLVGVQLGPGGGYILKEFQVTKQVNPDLVALVDNQIMDFLRTEGKASVDKVQKALNLSTRDMVTNALDQMKNKFELKKGVGIMLKKSYTAQAVFNSNYIEKDPLEIVNT